MKRSLFATGLKDGLPICIGYLSVAFAFGVFAVSSGLSVFQTVSVSACNVTSAGQLAGVGVMVAGGTCLELALTQLVINIRYALMSILLSQKLDGSVRLRDRFVLSFVVTDEVFGVASSRSGTLSRQYLYGLILLPFCGWTLGTLAGALAGDVFPDSVTTALGVAIYGMFIAIVLPAAKQDRRTALCVLLAVALSCLFRFTPVLREISGGFVVILCSVIAAAVFAGIDYRHPQEVDS